jgi:hypothetical protein
LSIDVTHYKIKRSDSDNYGTYLNSIVTTQEDPAVISCDDSYYHGYIKYKWEDLDISNEWIHGYSGRQLGERIADYVMRTMFHERYVVMCDSYNMRPICLVRKCEFKSYPDAPKEIPISKAQSFAVHITDYVTHANTYMKRKK